jgi:hypothetical protein
MYEAFFTVKPMFVQVPHQHISYYYLYLIENFNFWQGQEVFLYSTAPGPTLGPTQPPIQCIQGALSPEVKQAGYEADHSPASSAEVKNGGAILPLLHGLIVSLFKYRAHKRLI